MAVAEIIRCPSCGAKNRVTAEQRAKTPVCGRCKSPLPLDGPSGEVITVTDATFAAEVERSPLPVLVDLWAPWCGPCRMLAPAVEAIATDFAGRARVAKLNVDENPQTAMRFRANSIPLLLVISGGREVDRIIGLQPKAAIAQVLERHLR